MKGLTIGDIHESFYLLLDSQEVEEMNSRFNTDYDGFFVTLDNGDYRQVYGFEGSIPYVHKKVYEVKTN